MSIHSYSQQQSTSSWSLRPHQKQPSILSRPFVVSQAQIPESALTPKIQTRLHKSKEFKHLNLRPVTPSKKHLPSVNLLSPRQLGKSADLQQYQPFYQEKGALFNWGRNYYIP